jgi:hypothetical protein
MSQFKSEDDVRKMIKKKAHRVWWVENKRGGTEGFPDAVIAAMGRPIFAELKIAERYHLGGWKMEIAPTQLNVLRDMRNSGFRAMIIAGIAGTEIVGVINTIDRLMAIERISETVGTGRRGLYRAPGWDVFDMVDKLHLSVLE